MRTIYICGVKAEVAETFAQRAKGLIGRASLPPGRGLLIKRCNCIHTFFMRFPIDATFLDGEGRVVRSVAGIRPWRLWIWGGWRARQVLETQSRLLPSASLPALAEESRGERRFRTPGEPGSDRLRLGSCAEDRKSQGSRRRPEGESRTSCT